MKRISIHALREEGDKSFARRRRNASNFYPRPPRGGRHRRIGNKDGVGQDFYPRPPRGGRPRRIPFPDSGRAISIHALREEGDLNLNNPRSNSN